MKRLMRMRAQFEDRLAERLLDGRAPVEGASELAPLAGFLDDLRHSVVAAEGSVVAADTAMVAAMLEHLAAGARNPVSIPSRRKSVISKSRTAKAAMTAIALTTALTGAAAAAGELPDSLQEPISDIADEVGVDVPSPESTEESDLDETDVEGVDEGVEDEGVEDGGVEDEVEDEAVEGENHGSRVSAVAHETPAGPGHGQAVSAVARDNHGHNKDDESGDDESDESDNEDSEGATSEGSSRGRGRGHAEHGH